MVGLPRSGTTLTEQILASHSAVYGAGELMHINSLLSEVMKRPAVGEARFSAVTKLTAPELNGFSESYLDKLLEKDVDSNFVVDKMPDNVNLLGWIRLLFPNAKVIHCTRDLRDIALSCYQTCFGSIRWSNDWVHIAKRFKDYLRVVDHWKALPGIGWLEFPTSRSSTSPKEITQDA